MTSDVRIVGADVVAEPGVVLRDAEIALSPLTGLISYLGPRRGPLGAGDIDGTGRVAAPGLINGHTHAGISLLRGHSDDEPLQQWLTHIRAFEVRMTRADIRAGLQLSMAEMIRSGTVGFLDMFLWDSGLLADVHAAGLRVNAAPAVFGYDAVAFPLADPQTGAQVLDGTPGLAAEFAGDGLIEVGYGPHAPYSCGPELLADVARRAARNGLGVQIHLSETRLEVTESLAAHGRSPIALAADLGLLGGRTHVAHAVHPEPGDAELLAADGITVSYNPVSNLKLGAGIAPVPQYRSAGVALALGTDSMASNNSADLFEEVKTGALLQRGAHHDPAILRGADTFSMATSGGARALADRSVGATGGRRGRRSDPGRRGSGHGHPVARPPRLPLLRREWRRRHRRLRRRPSAVGRPTVDHPRPGVDPGRGERAGPADPRGVGAPGGRRDRHRCRDGLTR